VLFQSGEDGVADLAGCSGTVAAIFDVGLNGGLNARGRIRLSKVLE
jgi:hypothetical protein